MLVSALGVERFAAAKSESGEMMVQRLAAKVDSLEPRRRDCDIVVLASGPVHALLKSFHP